MRIEFSTIEPIFISKVELFNFQNSQNPIINWIFEEIIYGGNPFKIDGEKEEREKFLRVLADKMNSCHCFYWLIDSRQLKVEKNRQLKLENNVWYISDDFEIKTFEE